MLEISMKDFFLVLEQSGFILNSDLGLDLLRKFEERRTVNLDQKYVWNGK